MDLVNAHLFALVLATGVALPTQACDLARWQPHIVEAARRFDVPVRWIRAVIRAESAGCRQLAGRPTTSPAGAMGLMQLMPATWAELRQRHGLGADPHDPRDNILAGTAYLREMADRFSAPGAFAAYHAGPGRYAAYVLRATPLPPETRRYVAQVTADAGAIDELPAPADSLFAVVARARSGAGEVVPRSDPRLFVPLGPASASTQQQEHTDAER